MDDIERRRSDDGSRPEPPRPGSTPAEPERPDLDEGSGIADEGSGGAEEDEAGAGDGAGGWVPM